MATKPVKGVIESLYHGVSQQDTLRRITGQSEELVNARCSIAEGLTSRGGTKHVHTFTLGSTEKPFSTDFEWGSQQDMYHLLVSNSDVLVTDSDGVTHTVDKSAVAAYLTATTPSTAFTIHSFEDKIYILNTEKTCAMKSTVTPDRTRDLMIYSPFVTYERDYELFVDDVSQGTYVAPTYPTPGTGNVVVTPNYSSRAFLNWLVTQLVAAGVPCARRGKQVLSTGIVTKSISIDSDSSTGDYFVFQQDAEHVTDLPKEGYKNWLMRYVGKDNDNRTDYWLKFVSANGASGYQNGWWEETLAPGSKYIVEPSSMPLVLYLDGSTWKVKEEAWADRKVNGLGNPLPSIFGNKISWLGSFQNRLVFLSNGNYVTTQNIIGEDIPNLFITTVTQPLPTDPIDVSNAGKKQELLFGAMISHHMVITSRTGQFILNGSDALHNANLRLAQSSSVNCDPNVAPCVSNTSMFIVAPKGIRGYTQITEYMLDAARATPSTEVITKHTPSYIKGNIKQIACDSTNQLVFLLPDDSKTLYIYEYHKQEDRLVQSAWHTWTHLKTILSMSVLGGKLFLVTQDEDNVTTNIETMDITASSQDVDFWNIPTMDSQYIATPTLDGIFYQITVPYKIQETNLPRAIIVDGFKDDGVTPVLKLQGVAHVCTYIDEHTMQVSSMTSLNTTAAEAARVRLLVGYTFDSEITPTMPYPKDSQGKSYTGEKLLYTMWIIYYKRSSLMEFQIEYDGLPTVCKEMSNFILGDAQSKLGRPSVIDGNHKIKISGMQGKCQFKIIRKNSHIPFAISHINWGGRLTTKGLRV